MELPDVQYAKSGDVNIAYQVTGTGPFDLVFVPGFVTHLELGLVAADLRAASRAAFLLLAADSLRQARNGHVRPG